MTNLNQFTDVQKAAIDAFTGMADQAFLGMEKLTSLNMQVIKTSMAEMAESTQAALSAQSPQDVMALHTGLLQAAPQKVVAYGRQVKEIVDAATAQQRADAQAQVADVQGKFLEAVNSMLQNAPGSENTVALMKSAVAAANNAFEGVNRAGKQVGEVVEANITKFTETATKSAKAARPRSDA